MKPTNATAKTKARDLVTGWPRGKSTSAFTGVRYYDSVNGFRYREMRLPWERQAAHPPALDYSDWLQQFVVTPDFRRTTEQAIESSYRAGQQKMVDDYRAEYRRLTREDLQWLRTGDVNPLREAMKVAFYKQYVENLSQGLDIPLELALTIKNGARSDTDSGLRFRIATAYTENGQ